MPFMLLARRQRYESVAGAQDLDPTHAVRLAVESA
jgi:hypothetical protein